MSETKQAAVGSVVSLWRYPVKSMVGEQLPAADVTERGLVGDRAYALVDEATRKVASAKNPRKWGKLFYFRAEFVEPPQTGAKIRSVRISLPDGASVSSQQSDIHQKISSVLGREVTLTATAPTEPSLEEYWPDIDGLAHRETITDESMGLGAPAGTFFDYTTVHLLTTATLARLQELYPQGRFEVRRFRPNVVVEPAGRQSGFVENAWVGRTLAIGDEVRLRVTDPCPRCVMTTLPQGDLAQDAGILRTAAQHNRVNIPALGQVMPSVGVYAAVLRGGTIRSGDRLRLE